MKPKFDTEAKYMLSYHSPETSRTELKQFRWFLGMMWFLVGKGRPALLSRRYQIMTIGKA